MEMFAVPLCLTGDRLPQALLLNLQYKPASLQAHPQLPLPAAFWQNCRWFCLLRRKIPAGLHGKNAGEGMREQILIPWRSGRGGCSSAGAAGSPGDLCCSFSSVVALLVTGFGGPAPLFPFSLVQLCCIR